VNNDYRVNQEIRGSTQARAPTQGSKGIPRVMTKLLYDAAGAAELLSTTPKRISELRRAGKLGAVLDGKKYKFTAGELQRYIGQLPAYEPGAAS
jgi:hypothetical protein